LTHLISPAAALAIRTAELSSNDQPFNLRVRISSTSVSISLVQWDLPHLPFINALPGERRLQAASIDDPLIVHRIHNNICKSQQKLIYPTTNGRGWSLILVCSREPPAFSEHFAKFLRENTSVSKIHGPFFAHGCDIAVVPTEPLLMILIRRNGILKWTPQPQLRNKLERLVHTTYLPPSDIACR
jgi:hypothetical protein